MLGIAVTITLVAGVERQLWTNRKVQIENCNWAHTRRLMQAEKMERLHFEFCYCTGCPWNISLGVLWCYVGQSSFIDTTESFHGEPHLWVLIARLRSISHPLRIEIQSAFLFGRCCYWVSAQSQNSMWCPPHPKTPVHWAMLHTRISSSKC